MWVGRLRYLSAVYAIRVVDLGENRGDNGAVSTTLDEASKNAATLRPNCGAAARIRTCSPTARWSC